MTRDQKILCVHALDAYIKRLEGFGSDPDCVKTHRDIEELLLTLRAETRRG